MILETEKILTLPMIFMLVNIYAEEILL